jgi:hypothetical protein
MISQTTDRFADDGPLFFFRKKKGTRIRNKDAQEQEHLEIEAGSCHFILVQRRCRLESRKSRKV